MMYLGIGVLVIGALIWKAKMTKATKKILKRLLIAQMGDCKNVISLEELNNQPVEPDPMRVRIPITIK